MNDVGNNAMSIFGRVLEIDGQPERDAFLAQQCGGDAALRAEVDGLLQAFVSAGSIVQREHVSPKTEHNQSADEEPGSLIGPFKLLEKIGEGGMGIVYMAEQLEPVKRRVALKVIKAGMDSAEVVARFDAERQALALMDHPNIARVLDAGKTTAGRPYFVMELVKGIPITRFCDEHKLTPRQRLELFIPVCQAVQHAHQRGIIHRDVKPTNVLVATYDGKPIPKVIDFGVAKAIGQPLTEKTLFTGLGGIVGTLEYMSPEQAEFNSLDIDTRTDIYSLGVLIYELLTGSTPLTRQRLKDAALAEVLRLIKEEEPPKPSTRLSTSKGEALATISSQRHMDPWNLTKTIRGDLDLIVMKALEKDRNRRYSSANDLARDIEHFLADEPVMASPPSVMYRMTKFARRNKGAVAAALALAAMLVLAILGTSIGMVRALDAEGRAKAAARAEALQRQDADWQRDLAKTAESHALEARDNELRQLYAADMVIASKAVTDGPLSRAFDLLDAWLPERRDGKDFRGREWHLLRRLCDTSERTLVGHSGALRALAWTKDGKRLASGGQDRVIRIWDAETGQCVQSLIGHAGGIFDLAFSADGKLLASASADCTVRVWESETGKERHVLRGHILPVYAVAFHPDGKQLASAGGDTMIKFWDTASGAEQFVLQGHEAPVGRLQFDAQGARLASSGIVRGTLIWDLAMRKSVDQIKPNGDFVFSPDLKTGMYAMPGGKVGFMDISDKGVDQGDLGINGIHGIDMSASARVAAIAGSDDAIRVIDRDTTSTLVTHRGHIGGARRVLLRSDMRKLASAGDDGTVRIWDIPDAKSPRPFSGHHEHIVTASAFSRDGALFASGDYLGSIALWNPQTGKRDRWLGSHYIRRKADKNAVEIGSGKPIKEGLPVKHVTGYSARSTSKNPIVQVFTMQGHGGAITGLAFTPNKDQLVSTGAKELIVWDLKTGKVLFEFEHPTLVSSLALSPDGSLVATACWDDIVRVFRVPSGELIKQLEGHRDDVMSVAFHPSGKELASGSRDQTAIVWEIETGKIKHQLRRHVNTVSVVRYTPDGKRLVTGGMDKAIHVWNAESGKFESTLHGHVDGVTSLAFSADGSTLVTASDGTDDIAARTWRWSVDRFRESALVQVEGGRGPSAVAVDPATSEILMGRVQLKRFDTQPFAGAPRIVADSIAPEALRDKLLPENRLKVLGYALIDEIGTWPDSDKGKHKPAVAGGKFLVLAVSLPFGRLKISESDYRRLCEIKKKDADETEPLKFSSMVIYPGRFTISGPGGKQAVAEYVGRMALSEQEGFEFMKKGVAMMESMTATPRLDDREHVYLAWEVAQDYAIRGLRLRFENDEPVTVPDLALQMFRPGKPFHSGVRSFDAGEGGTRLRSNLSRSAVP